VLLHGPNGAGKTNLLEALHLGSQGFSPRARADAQMIAFGAQEGRVTLTGTSGPAAFTSDVRLAALQARRASLNGDKLSSAERLRHELRALVFTPDRLAVVKGAPATRRAYLDRSLGRLFPARADLPVEYAAAVGQRNACLRRVRIGDSTTAALRPWTEAVATLGATLVAARQQALALLVEPFERVAGELGLADARLAYDGDPPTLAELGGRLARDLERGLTGAGPHLHDVRIEAGTRDLRVFGSQGEQRLAVLALVLAEAEALGAEADREPLVLLDDVLSELDQERRRSLARLVAEIGQTVITTTSSDAFPAEPAQTLAVSRGVVA